ncbi:MAG: hypothetical protein V7641_4514 [Blastocatellia bacterium]
MKDDPAGECNNVEDMSVGFTGRINYRRLPKTA